MPIPGFDIYEHNELLDFSSYLVVSKYNRKTNRDPKGVFFNKIMSLTNKITCDEKGIDIKLPHYWYRYGDQVHQHGMPNALTWNHESPWKTTVQWNDVKPMSYDSEEYRFINKLVDELINKYLGKTKELIQDVYTYAPFDFQRDMLNLRSTISGWKNALNWDSETYKHISREVILSSPFNFPEFDFPELKEQYKIYKELISIILEKENWDVLLFKDIANTFWFLFCYYLRLKRVARQNIPNETVKYWEAKLDFETEKYRGIMGDLIIDANKKYPKIKRNKLLEREYIWRLKDIEETRLLIEEFAFT